MRIITQEKLEAQYRLQKGFVELAEVSVQEYLDFSESFMKTTENMTAAIKKYLAERARSQGGNLLTVLNAEIKKTTGYGSAKVYFAPTLLDGETVYAEFIEEDHLSRLEKKVNLVRLGDFEEKRHAFFSLAYYIDEGYMRNDAFITSKINLTKMVTNIDADYMLVTSQEYSDDIAVVKATAYKIAGPKPVVSEGDKFIPMAVAKATLPNTIALDYAKRLLAGNAGGTVLDWKKQ